MNGTKIMLMTLGRKIKFVDSLNYFHMKLSALPKAFGFEDEATKGWFPHLFNKSENQKYSGPIPSREYYTPECMSSLEKLEFDAWFNHLSSTGYTFKFADEIVKYCLSDVNILRKACSAFRQDFIKIGGTCPFAEASTIASACSKIFRKNYLKPDIIGVIPARGYRKTNNHSRASLEWLLVQEHTTGREIIHAGKSSEFRLKENILVDGYCQDENGIQYVYQFLGCFWHGCPSCFIGADRHKKLEAYGDSYEERFKKTVENSNRIKSHGYVLEEIWECEFKQIQRNNNNNKINEYLKNHPYLFNDTLNPRDAFYGGRTENIVSLIETTGKQTIGYVDICSLYPFVCKTGKFPVGHPQIYVGDDCKMLTGLSHDISKVEGLIKCKILAPRDLFLPVLPVRMHGKLLFPLCWSCVTNLNNDECTHEHVRDRELSGTWVSDEIKKAVEVGYIVMSIEEIWQYNTCQYDPTNNQSDLNTNGLFVDYINTFLKIKQEASGWPRDCINEESRVKYINDYKEKENILLEKDKIAKNPGLRSLSKLCLNSFWGKFGQRENMDTTEIVRTGGELQKLILNDKIEVKNILPFNNEVFYVNWSFKGDNFTPSSVTNVAIAAYTTAQARLKLYTFLEKLGKRVLYYDTDSCIYINENIPGEYKIPTGSFLGDMTDELEEYEEGSYISHFVSAGPKFYSYIVKTPSGKTHEICKVKGLTLNTSTSEKINYNAIKKLILDKDEKIIHHYNSIRRTKLHSVISIEEVKTLKCNSLKRKFSSENTSIPYGYKRKKNVINKLL